MCFLSGTKEHRQRLLEMKRTEELAQQVTDVNEGRTFIGDYIPADELAKFNADIAKAKGIPLR